MKGMSNSRIQLPNRPLGPFGPRGRLLKHFLQEQTKQKTEENRLH
jgi:hypothetical protein